MKHKKILMVLWSILLLQICFSQENSYIDGITFKKNKLIVKKNKLDEIDTKCYKIKRENRQKFIVYEDEKFFFKDSILVLDSLNKHLINTINVPVVEAAYSHIVFLTVFIHSNGNVKILGFRVKSGYSDLNILLKRELNNYLEKTGGKELLKKVGLVNNSAIVFIGLNLSDLRHGKI